MSFRTRPQCRLSVHAFRIYVCRRTPASPDGSASPQLDARVSVVAECSIDVVSKMYKGEATTSHIESAHCKTSYNSVDTVQMIDSRTGTCVAAPTNDTLSAQERSRALGAWHRANQPPLDLGAFPAAGEDSREDPTLPPSPPLQAPSQRGVAALPSSSPAGDDDRTPRVAQEEPTDGRIGDAGGGTGVRGVNAVLVIACSVCVSLVVGCL